ncbi:LOW QUALITY PROTEIN: LRR domain containing protein [Trema orientale]|uniref:LRR domain containing protein n=1 Tax=Trema orientale TaxID=63057 RepID=A0A2P5CN18_TREOI|nr:LOW QUALITY PROTEIN: LRR domain containing protein [Trema orientale]
MENAALRNSITLQTPILYAPEFIYHIMAIPFKPIKMLLLLIVIFLAEATIFVTSERGNSGVLCVETEKQALLSFKQNLVDPSNRLMSWVSNGDDCCKWTGIVCDNITGHVKELDLATTLDVDGNSAAAALRGKINPSLLNLTYLTHLDLSYNDFGGTPIPSFIGSLVSLRYLNLTSAGFEGKIPHQLGNLSSLSHLGLRGPSALFYGHKLYAENLHWLSGLSLLKYLDLDNVNLSKASDWVLSVNKLPSLLELCLSYSELSHIHPLSYVNFTSLEVLDISENSFHSLMPDWIFSLSRLVHLDLRGSYFEGPFPNGSWTLPSLKNLDVSLSYLNSTLPDWFFGLNNLVNLHLRANGFEGSIPCGFQNMTLLKFADLSENYFNSTIPNCLYGFSSLEDLDLHSNDLQGVISSAIGNMTSLVRLDLSYNALGGKIPPSTGKLCNLKSISLGGNKYGGKISEALENLLGCSPNRIVSLDLGENLFSGQLTDNIEKFKNLGCVWYRIRILFFKFRNNFYIESWKDKYFILPTFYVKTISGFEEDSNLIPNAPLVFLSLGGNMLSGPIPTSLGKLSALEVLYIDGNRLNGSLPESFGSLSNLEQLYISKNLLEGVVSEIHFANLTNLRDFYASGNSLMLRVSPDWIPPFQLTAIELRSWSLGPHFPMWLKSQKNFWDMDLSETGISDAIPNWFWNLSTSISYLNLSHNQISGRVPDIRLDAGSFSMIYLGSNKFEGHLPRISSTVTELDLSNNSFSGDISHFLCQPLGGANRLTILHLGDNVLSGNIPDCWMYWPSLEVIKLGNDNLTGEIPSSMGSLRNLKSLHLRNNSLSGEIPISLQNCTVLSVIDLGLNKFVGSIPTWIGVSLSNLMILGLRSNKLRGRIPFELCRLTLLQVLDIADNNLSGTIPRCFDNFKAMVTRPSSSDPIFYSFYYGEFLENAFVVTRGREDQYNTILTLVASLDLSNNNLSGEFPVQLTSLHGLLSLNLSGNHLRGSIPATIGSMTGVQSLDFSRNQLSGKIPPSVSNLHFLSLFNVSFNSLSGEIPLSTQIQSMDTSNFVGNRLCGPPLPECGASRETMPGTEQGGGKDEEEYWFRLGIAVGFVVGFLGIISPLLLYRTWRHAYFWFVEQMWYKILDCFGSFKYLVRT